MKYAIALEKQLTKDEILERYLNIAPFGQGAYGIWAASQVYFGKQPKDLTTAEAALLASLVKAPTRLQPGHQRVASRSLWTAAATTPWSTWWIWGTSPRRRHDEAVADEPVIVGTAPAAGLHRDPEHRTRRRVLLRLLIALVERARRLRRQPVRAGEPAHVTAVTPSPRLSTWTSDAPPMKYAKSTGGDDRQLRTQLHDGGRRARNRPDTGSGDQPDLQ